MMNPAPSNLSPCLLVLCLASAPAAAGAADEGAFAVLRAAPTPARAGCAVTRAKDGELHAALYAEETAACPVARVAGDEITLAELTNALATQHLARGAKAAHGEKPKGMDFAPTLDRLVDVRLLVHEAREMGLLELPDSKDALEAFRDSTLRTMLQQESARPVKADPAEVDRLFKAAVKQWKLRSVMFAKEEDAKAFGAAVAKGGPFEALVKAAAAEKKAEGGEPIFVAPARMVPELATAAAALKSGQVGPPVKVTGGWVVMKLEGIRYPEDAKALEEARAKSLAEQQHRAVQKLHEALVKKYAVVDRKLLDGLDLEVGGEAAFQALAKDPRPLATIRGEPPLTVGDVTSDIAKKFFHGIGDPIKEHRVNKAKADTFEILLGARLFGREARERRLDQRPAFQRRVAEYERVLAFNTFLERVIIPGVKVVEPEVQARYQARQAEFTSPQMYRLDGLAFSSAAAAQAALEQLRGGTDPDWLRANATGLLKPEAQQLRFDGTLLSAATLPASLVKALAGAQRGDLRLHASDDGRQHSVVRVLDQVAPGTKPYPEVRETLAREVEAEKIGAAVRDYAAKLRGVQPVDVLIGRMAG